MAQPSCVPWSLDDADVIALMRMTKEKLSPSGHAWVTYGNREQNGVEQFKAAAEEVGLIVEDLPLEEIIPEDVLHAPRASALRRVKVFCLQHASGECVEV